MHVAGKPLLTSLTGVQLIVAYIRRSTHVHTLSENWYCYTSLYCTWHIIRHNVTQGFKAMYWL